MECAEGAVSHTGIPPEGDKGVRVTLQGSDRDCRRCKKERHLLCHLGVLPKPPKNAVAGSPPALRNATRASGWRVPPHFGPYRRSPSVRWRSADP
ncbi:hypothetical protein TNCT_29061 [Trichonephila clavata]|uniref:Uncharacterized protein n=1 Tax=Trichonephila clavata TaxID=2740835 RepID=A0A8X6FX16_TRICU|nr:hypothetical protein TNCT_29061 [Trichonephila clavata]